MNRSSKKQDYKNQGKYVDNQFPVGQVKTCYGIWITGKDEAAV